MKSLQCGTMCNALISRNLGASYISGCFHHLKSRNLLIPVLTKRNYLFCTFKTTAVAVCQKSYHSEEKSGLSQKLEVSQKGADNLFSIYGTRTQFDLIRAFVSDESNLPSPEKWVKLRQDIISCKGGKIKEDNIDGNILAQCVSHLAKTKSFIQYLNQKNKKINAQQMSHLFKSFYLNKEKCSTDDLLFIKKMFGAFIKEKKVNLPASTVENLLSGISITDAWKQGVLLLEATGTYEVNTMTPLVEAALFHDDMNFALEYLRRIMKLVKKFPDSLLNYWIRLITTRRRVDEFLEFLHESNVVLTKTSADLLVTQCHSHPDLYTCSYTSIGQRSSQCHHCRQTLEPLRLNHEEFEHLKQVFLNRTLVGQDVFQKTTPRELIKYLKFLDRCEPYDIVLDALNVAHYGGIKRQPETLHKVVTHYLNQGANLLVLGRMHMKRWPASLVRLLQDRCQVFYVDNLSQDDPYILYAAMQGGLHTKFISRDLMRSHIFLLKEQGLRSTFLKWQQLNQIVILSVSGAKIIIRDTPTYVHQVQCIERQDKPTQWHVPYREEIEESSFEHVYTPKSTWLCLESKMR